MSSGKAFHSLREATEKVQFLFPLSQEQGSDKSDLLVDLRFLHATILPKIGGGSLGFAQILLIVLFKKKGVGVKNGFVATWNGEWIYEVKMT